MSNKISLLEYAPAVAAQWHPTKNGALGPQDVSHGSGRKVWWLGNCGHEWETTILRRSHGEGCPVCAGRRVLPGENDLATVNPEVASQWHPIKNGNLTPSQVPKYSNRKVWWVCSLGHEWQTTVQHRTLRRNGCPYCAGQAVWDGLNDLSTVNPALAAQWHPEKNGGLTPQMVSTGSTQKVWWLGECGHEWEAVIYNRTRGRGCPFCASGGRAKKSKHVY